MKLKFFIVVSLSAAAAAALLAFSQKNNAPFAPAADFPRAALVYVQISDLPALVKLWNESNFKEKYAGSENFAAFRNNHLGRKLASRWQEFNAASGFPVDPETIAGLAKTRAALALYDIGKLEFVFIAPVSEEVFAAANFLHNGENFAAETLDDGTKIYRVAVEADRGRQRQELIFTHLKGRFIAATSEKLLVQTLHNIHGRERKNRLTDDPAFAALSEKIAPHLATVWVDQTALNADYYFRRYWLMSDIAGLENIRAGIFDFEIQPGKILEHRLFLLKQKKNISPLKAPAAGQILSRLPANIPFYRLQAPENKTLDRTVQAAIFDRAETRQKSARKTSHRYSSYDYGDYDWHDYSSLSEDFDENIDETDDIEAFERKTPAFDFSKPFQAAQPQAILSFTAPKALPAPLFIEFERAAIFHLAAPEDFDRNGFEAEIARKFSAQTLIAAPAANGEFVWETKSENGLSWRELHLPMSGWGASYVLRGSELILTNDAGFLREIVAAERTVSELKIENSVTEKSVINLAHRATAFDQIFARFAEKKIAEDFFTGNISSLLDALAEIERIEITRRYAANLLEEEITASFGQP